MLLASAALVPGLALAQDSGMSYTFVEAGWLEVDPDGGAKVDGWQLNGSLALADMWHVNAQFAQIDSDLDIYRVGGGMHYGLNQSLDLVGQVSWVRADAGSSADGFGMTALLRGKLTRSFELEGGVDYVDLGSDGGGDATRFVGAGRYFFTPAFAAGLNVSIGDYLGGIDANTYGVDFRYNFK
jgi:hypothetical protein